MHHSYFYILILLCNYVFIAAQDTPLEIDWNKNYSAYWSDEANDIIQNKQGGLTFVGATKGIFKTKKDVYLVELDKKGEVVFRQVDIARPEEDVANALIQTLDGGYAIVGYTESPTKNFRGKRDAWIIKTDEKGNVLWNSLLGSAEDDEFFDVLEDETGNLIACGYQGGNACLARFDAQGKQLEKEKIYSSPYPQKLRAIAPTKDGDYILTGEQYHKKNRVKVLLIKTDKLGNKLWSHISTSEDGIGYDVIEDQQGNFVIAGANRVVQDDVLLQSINKDRKIAWTTIFGKRGDDVAHSLIQTFNGDYYTVGKSYAHSPKAHRPKIWLSRFNNEGEEVWDEPLFFGGKYQDVGNSIIQMNDGSLVLAGYSASDKSDFKDAIVYKFKSGGLPQVGAANIRLHGQSFIENKGNNNGILDHLERGYYQFYLSNEGANDAYNIIASVKKSTQLENDITYFPTVHIGHLPAGETRLVSIPIIANRKQITSEHRFEVNFSAANGTRVAPFKFAVESRAKPTAQLVVENIRLQSEVAYRGQQNELNLRVRNRGDKTADGVSVQFNLAHNIEVLNQKSVKIGRLAPNQSRDITLSFRASEVYLQSSMDIGVLVLETSGKNVKQVINIPVETKAETVEIPMVSEPLVLRWLSPREAIVRSTKNNQVDDNIWIELVAESDKPLDETHFSVLINGKKPSSGGKYNKVRLTPARSDVDRASQKYSYIFSYNCELKRGDNRIEVFVKNEAGEASATPLIVNYEPYKPNLYLLAIGVPHSDLEFTEKDANDMVESYKQREGSYFNKIYTKLLNKKENTTATEIKTAITTILNNTPVRLTEKDMLIIYISSHGFIKSNDNRFKIEASDSNLDIENTTIDFEKHIYEVLNQLNSECQKLVLVDACQVIKNVEEYQEKGVYVPEKPSNGVTEIMKEYSDIWGINSCSPKEQSFEDTGWGNGAFTKALLEAFRDDTVDKGGDGELDINELYLFLKERVPSIVATKRNLKKGETQTPFMPQKQGQKDFKLLQYD